MPPKLRWRQANSHHPPRAFSINFSHASILTLPKLLLFQSMHFLLPLFYVSIFFPDGIEGGDEGEHRGKRGDPWLKKRPQDSDETPSSGSKEKPEDMQELIAKKQENSEMYFMEETQKNFVNWKAMSEQRVTEIMSSLKGVPCAALHIDTACMKTC